MGRDQKANITEQTEKVRILLPRPSSVRAQGADSTAPSLGGAAAAAPANPAGLRDADGADGRRRVSPFSRRRAR
jgi:hypothetical protein